MKSGKRHTPLNNNLTYVCMYVCIYVCMYVLKQSFMQPRLSSNLHYIADYGLEFLIFLSAGITSVNHHVQIYVALVVKSKALHILGKPSTN